MLNDFFFYVKLISLYIAITFIIVIIMLDLKKKNNKFLFIIIAVCLITEIVSLLLVISNQTHYIGLTYTISMIIHAYLWLKLLFSEVLKRKATAVMLAAFLLFSFTNLFFGEGFVKCNFNTFIFGAFTYISIFIYESFYQLKKENFIFFQSNNYLLLFSPVLFFFGLSFVFGFKSKALAETHVFVNLGLYDFIIYFVNIIYYTLINIYIYREKKLKHA